MAISVGAIKYDLDLDDSKFKGKAQGASRELEGLAGSFKAAEAGSKIFAVGIGLAAAAIVAFGVKSVQAFAEAQAIDAQLNQVLISTGKSATISADSVSKLATEIEHYSGLSDEAVKSGATMLLQFDGMTADTLPAATKAMADVSVRMGKDTVAAARALGIALTDPEAGMLLLKRSAGIILPDALKETIKGMVASGDMAGAQAILFKELDKAVGGAAEAYGKTFAGQMDIAKEKFDDFQELIGAAIVDKLQPLVKAFNDWFDSMGGAQGIMDRFNNEIFPALQNNLPIIIGFILGGLAPAFWAAATGAWALLAPLLPFIAAGVLIGAAVQLLVNAFGGWGVVMATLQPAFDAIGMVFRDLILPQLQLLWNEIQTNLLPALNLLWQELGPVLMPVLQALAGFLGLALLGAIMAVITILRVVIGVITMWVENVNWAIKTIKELFSGIPGSISASLSGIFDIITSPFRRAFDDIKRMAQDMMNAVKNALNMEKRHSPSVIDIVKRGVGLVNIELAKVGEITIPTLSEGLTGGSGSSSSSSTNTSNSVQVYVDHVGDMSDVQAIGRELGFKLSLMPH